MHYQEAVMLKQLLSWCYFDSRVAPNIGDFRAAISSCTAVGAFIRGIEGEAEAMAAFIGFKKDETRRA